MPYIQCHLQPGLSRAQKQSMMAEISEALQTHLGSPKPYIHISIREFSADEFTESGESNRDYALSGPKPT
jgi:4-oxalocrotonate tautomerase family enzyme